MKWTNWGWGKVDLRWWGVQWSGVQGKRWWWQNPKSEPPGLGFGEGRAGVVEGRWGGRTGGGVKRYRGGEGV